MFAHLTIKRMMILATAVIMLTLAVLLVAANVLLNRIAASEERSVFMFNAMTVAREARFWTIQVQQFLTDAGATGDTGPLKEAEEARTNAQMSLESLGAMVPSLLARSDALKQRVGHLHTLGVQMARAYIDGGRTAGNAIMKRPNDGVDALAAALAVEMNTLVDELMRMQDLARADAESAIATTRWLVLWSSLGLVAFTLYVMVQMFRRVVPPLRQLLESLRDIGEGEGDLTVKLRVDGADEFADVARSFNIFVTRIRSLVRQVTCDSGRLSQAEIQVSQATESTQQSMAQLTAETGQMLQVTQDLMARVHEVRSYAELATASARNTDEEAGRGADIVRETIAAIHRLADDVVDSSERMGSLEGDVREVSTVLEVIKEIADQTNLLALNAAIEAARAGEQGRGFAVVADEVRKLAQRTQDSTQRIQEIIRKLQQGAADVAVQMKNGRERTAEGVHQAERAGTALDNITQAARTINTLNGQIAAAVMSQSEAADRICGSIHRTVDVTRATAEATHRASVSIGEMGELMGHLMHAVSQFQVNEGQPDLS